MKIIELKIKNKIYNVKLAITDEEHEEGLQNVDNMPENEGMLFIFDEPQEVGFWMKNTKIPLDIIFIDEDKEVISVVEGEPLNEEDIIEEDDVKYVLELNAGSKVKPGIEVKFEEGILPTENGLHVLDLEGNTQMLLKGGERIFSRKNTKIIIKLAKNANESKEDKDYKKLGKKLFDYLNIQEENEDEYVNDPKAKKSLE